jgi:predicted peptidase
MRLPLTARRLLAPTAVLALTVLALMVGCASSPSSTTEDTQTDATASSEPTEATGPSVTPACNIAPASLIKETLKVDVAAPTQTSSGTSIDCDYQSGSGHNVIVHFESEQDAASFADGRHNADSSGEPTSDVSGVGDEAYQSSVEFGDTVTNTMVARKGTVSIKVDAAATLDGEKALLTKLFAAIA